MSITRLSDHRKRKVALHRAAIWTPQDAIDTAQAFHAELAKAERGVSTNPTPEKRSVAPLAPNRSHIHDRCEVALTVRTAAIAVQIIGVMWALIALTYCGRVAEATRDFFIAIGVTAAGFIIWLIVGWIESRR